MTERKRGDGGEFVDEVEPDAILAVFDEVPGSVVTSADVADALSCSDETARKKLDALVEAGRVRKRTSAGRNLYWLTDDESGSLSSDDPFFDRTTFRGGEPTNTSKNTDRILYGDPSG